MTDQPPPHDPYAKPPSGASAAPPPGADQPGSWSSPDSPPPGEYGAPPPPPPASDVPSPSYGTPPPGYGAPAPTYGAPAPGYGPAPTYGAAPGGSAPLSPDASSVRTQGIVWTIVNGISIFFCGNLLGIAGLVFGILGITRASTDVAGAKRNVRLSWILFVVGIVLTIVFWIVVFAALGSAAFDPATYSTT